MSNDFLFKTQKNNVLRISAYGLDNLKSVPWLIYVHGFKGFKDWGYVPYTAQYFAKKGFIVLTFNFSHNGVGESLVEFDELDKFAKNTFSLEISELNELISAYKEGFFGKIAEKGIGLLGHSRGGAISLLVGSEREEVKAVCTWASLAKLDRYSERQKVEWRNKGYLEVLNTRTKQLMRLNVSLLDDIEKNKEGSLNIETAVKSMRKPLLLAHGINDLAVPVSEAEILYDWANKKQSEIYKIFATGHTFDVKHPFEGSNKKLDSLLEKTNNFFKSNLS